MITPSDRPVRVAGASGSVSDRRHALATFARNYLVEPVDVICCDYMSEGTMAPAAMRMSNKAKNPDGKPSHLLDPIGPAFETTFLEALEPALEDLAKHGIRVACNAGGSDTKTCYEAVMELIRKKGLDIPVAWVDGDNVLDALKKSLDQGTSKFNNIHTGQELQAWMDKYGQPLAAQAYLGGLGVAEAFKQGAQIVVCGRVSDASPYIGAAHWWHGWSRDMLDHLANAFVMGHLLECSTYVTGGNYSGFQQLEHGSSKSTGWTDLGFPIGEITADGGVIITKQQNTGGAVTTDTCSSQLLYEIQGPYYFNSDVTAVLSDLWFEQLAPDRVALRGVKALPPPPTTKVGITALGGYQAESLWFLTGLDIEAKARMLEAQLRKVLEPYSKDYSLLKFHTIGSDQPDADTQDSATCMFRVFAQAKTEEAVGVTKFLRPICDNIMQPYPGGTYHLDIRQGLPKPYYEYYSTLIPQSEIQHAVHFNGTSIVIPPPEKTHTFEGRQPSQAETEANVNLEDFGPTERLPFGKLVYARSGDKGSDCNCGLWIPSCLNLSDSEREEAYTWLRSVLSISTVKQLLGREITYTKGDGTEGNGMETWTNSGTEVKIERFELPNLKGVHFLFRGLLDRGVTSTGGIDFLGKNVAEFLRQRVVNIPRKFLQPG